MDEIKICRVCKCSKSLSEYNIRKSKKSHILRTECKDCLTELQKERYEKRKLLPKKKPKPKVCRICKVKKKIIEFRKHSSTPDGLETRCKSCASDYEHSDVMKAYHDNMKKSGKRSEMLAKFRKKNKKKLSDCKKAKRRNNLQTMREIERIQRFQKRIRALKILGGVCKECNENDPNFLAVDHISDDGFLERKEITFSSLAAKIISGKVDISKYQVLCFNHNREKEWRRIHNKMFSVKLSDTKKKCARCLCKVPVELFRRTKGRALGVVSFCKICEGFWKAFRKMRVLNKLGGECACCGNLNPIHLEIDHIDGGGAKKRREGEDVKLYIAIDNDTIDYSHLQLLCVNCNMSKSHNNNICHHKVPKTV